MTRLSAATIDNLPSGIRRPAYDRAALTPGIVHLGLGAFSRCHLAEYTDDALEHTFGPWGIRAINLRAPDLGPLLDPQDRYYIRELRDGRARDRRVIGALCGAMTVTDDAGLNRALAQVADPATKVVTMTVTEKGYCQIPATSALDPEHPDIVHDLAHPDRPRSVPGFVLRAIRMARAAGHAPPAFLSCDNVPGNGQTLRTCVLTLARDADVAWIDDHVAFPDTMVDRIAPATKPADIAALTAETGITDQALVIGEPFRMWVIGADLRARLPAWHAAGAIITPNVAPYEAIKMRVLNGMQTGLCHLAHMAGHVTTAAMVADPVFVAFARRIMRHEVMPHLPRAPGIDHAAYIAQSIARLQNTALEHTTAQISTDGSRKIRQRLLEPLTDALRAGRPAPGIEIEMAGWIAHVMRFSRTDMGISDPVTPAIIAATGGDLANDVAAILRMTDIFPAALTGFPGLGERLAGLVMAIGGNGPRAVMAAHLGLK